MRPDLQQEHEIYNTIQYEAVQGTNRRLSLVRTKSTKILSFLCLLIMPFIQKTAAKQDE